jgi:hypothetical protein
MPQILPKIGIGKFKCRISAQFASKVAVARTIQTAIPRFAQNADKTDSYIKKITLIVQKTGNYGIGFRREMNIIEQHGNPRPVASWFC